MGTVSHVDSKIRPRVVRAKSLANGPRPDCVCEVNNQRTVSVSTRANSKQVRDRFQGAAVRKLRARSISRSSEELVMVKKQCESRC